MPKALTYACGVHTANGELGSHFQDLGLAHAGITQQEHVDFATNL
jgi:hypothetical protein